MPNSTTRPQGRRHQNGGQKLPLKSNNTDQYGARYGLETIRDSSASFELNGDVGSPHSIRNHGQSRFVGFYGTIHPGGDGTDEASKNAMEEYVLSQQDQIRDFSRMVQHATYLEGEYTSPGVRTRKVIPPPPPPPSATTTQQKIMTPKNAQHTELCYGHDDEHSEYDDEDHVNSFENRHKNTQSSSTFMNRVLHMLDPTEFLISDAKYDELGHPYFDEHSYTAAAFFRHFFYNPVAPEFTSLQQFDWAVIIGIAMGFFTAFWHWCIEAGVEFWWETVPTQLHAWGCFTELDGRFPLYHYMWILPSIFGAALSYSFANLQTKIPSQDDWIKNTHSVGVQDHRTFFILFFLSTCGLWSGLSLGPELPLTLTGGMVGSWLAIITKQSVLQARVLNLTAASAAISGFFGFPMAGALFVLEL